MDPFDYEIRCTVMSLRSRKRNRNYLRKIWYLRSLLNLLVLYRAYLQWKFKKRRHQKQRLALGWRRYDAIAWKSSPALRLNPNIRLPKVFTIIYHFHYCQLTATCLIRNESFSLLIVHDELTLDKDSFAIFLSSSHETRSWREFLIALGRCRGLLIISF